MSNTGSENHSENHTDFPNRDQTMFDRLCEAFGTNEDAKIAIILGISTQAVNSSKKKPQLPLSWITKAAESYGYSADWLLFGTEPKKRIREERRGGERRQTPEACDPEIKLIPMVTARLSAGTGSLETTGEITGKYAFRTEFLMRKGHPDSMVLMRVTGDSMEPDIWSGDTVLIDQSQKSIIAGGIYAVGIDDAVVVKYVDMLPGRLVLRSKNKEYASIEVSLNGDLADGVRIIGRVIWWCREAK